MKYDIRKTSQFKKDFETVLKRGLDINEFRTVLELLVSGSTIPEKYRDHPLQNSKDFKNCRELHIEPDWLLIYKIDNKVLILTLVATGSHSELLGI